MSKFKLSFTLKQHTPLIHFQHEQEGATLRGTEVKPKLDALIFAAVEKDGKKIPDSWLVGNGKTEHRALNYKINFKAKDRDEYWFFSYVNHKVLPEINSYTGVEAIANVPFFADASNLNTRDLPRSKWEEMRKGLIHKEILASFFSLKTDLLKIVKEYFPVLIASHNFGTRQSKGFGSFEVVKLNDATYQADFVGLIKKNPKLKGVYLSNNASVDFKIRLQKIAEEYQLLKSGINRPNKFKKGTYAKSLLFQFLCKKDVRWEKRWIKRQIDKVGQERNLLYQSAPLDCDGENDWDDLNEDYNYRYARVLLGLAEHNEYLKQYKGRQDNKSKLQIKIEDAAGDIQRFRSPLTFTMWGGNSYLLVHEIPSKIRQSAFKFTLFDKPSNGSARRLSEFSDRLQVPTEDDFDLIEFLDWSFDLMNNIKKRNDPRPDIFRDDLYKFAFTYTKKYSKP